VTESKKNYLLFRVTRANLFHTLLSMSMFDILSNFAIVRNDPITEIQCRLQKKRNRIISDNGWRKDL
jgi:hypothetical protein